MGLSKIYFMFFFFFSFLLSNFVYADSLDTLVKDIGEENYSKAEISIKTLFQETFHEEINPFENCYNIDDVKKLVEEYNKKCSGLISLINNESDLNKKNISLVENQEHLLLKEKILKGLKKKGISRDKVSLNAYYLAVDYLSLLKSKVPVDDKKDKDQGNDESKDKDQDEDEENPWDTDSDHYKPKNKDFSSEKGRDKLKAILIESNAPLTSPLMGSKIYETINASGWSRSSVGRKSFYKESSQVYDYKVFTFGQNDIPLPLPLGYKPVLKNPTDSSFIKIIEKSPEEFLLHYEGQHKIIELSLNKMELDRTQLVDSYFGFRLKQRYASKTGVNLDLYPDEIKNWVDEIKKKNIRDHITIANALADYIKKEFSYYSKDEFSQDELNTFNKQIRDLENKGIPNFIAMAKIKVIQCDGTATLMASILRDFFEIPVRIVSGRTAVRRNGTKIVVRASDPLHAWIHVWDIQKGWVEVDGTPAIKNKKNKDKKDKDKNKDKKIKNKDTSINKDKDKDQDRDQDGEKGTEKVINDLQIGGDSILKEAFETLQTVDLEDIVKKLMDFRVSLAATLYGRPQEKIKELNEALLFLEKLIGTHELKAERYFLSLIENESYRLEKYENISSGMFLTYMKNDLRQGNYDKFFDDLLFLIDDFNFLKKFRSLTDSETAFYHQLEEIKRELMKINHPDAKSYSVVRNFMAKLPGNLTRSLLMNKYGGQASIELGSQANIKLAHDLNESKDDFIRGMQQMISLNKFAQFKLKRLFTPSYKVLYEGAPTKQPQKEKVEVPVLSVMDIASATLPLKSLDGVMLSFVNGELESKGYRQGVLSKRIEIKKQTIVTVILVDESGSMEEGHRKEFSQALIASYVDRAKTEEMKDKNITHHVIIIPFSGYLGKMTLMMNKDLNEPREYISSFMRGRPIMKGGTDIQKALVEAYNEIARSYAPTNTRTKKTLDLRRANIWLITDGETFIDKPLIEAAKAQIPQDVSILLHATNLGSRDNEEIKKIANSYSNISESEIQASMSEISSLDHSGFASLLSVKDFPYTIYKMVDDLDINTLKGPQIPYYINKNVNIAWDLKACHSFLLDQLTVYFLSEKKKKLMPSDPYFPLLNIFLRSLANRKIHPVNYKKIMPLFSQEF